MRTWLKKARRPVGLITVISTLCVFLGGCALSGAREEIRQSNPVDLSFSWWGNDVRHQYTLAGLDLFQDRNKDMHIDCTFGVWDGFERRMNVFMKSQTEADVMQINYDWLAKYSPDGEGFLDLREISDELDLGCFTEQDLALGSRNGHLNALPIAYNTSAFFYNMTLLGKYGITEVPKTWDDLFTAAGLLSKDGIYMLGTGRKHMFLLLQAWFAQSQGHPMFDTEGNFTATQDELESVLAFYKKCFTSGLIIPVDDFSSADLVGGRVASLMCWSSDAERLCQSCADAGNDVRLGLPPVIQEGTDIGWYIKPASLYAISVHTEHPGEAGRLLNFLLNDPDMAALQGAEKGVPVSSTALALLKESGDINAFTLSAYEQMKARMDSLSIIVPIVENDELITAFKDESDKYLYNEINLRSCAVNVLWQLQKILGK